MSLSSLHLKYSSSLVRLAGLISICGGVLWVALLLVVQLQMLGIAQFYDVPEPPCCDLRQPYALEDPILAVPMVLFLFSLVGLYVYTKRQLALSTLGVVGVILSLGGTILAIVHVFVGEYWPWWFGGWWYGGYGGLVDPHYMPPTHWLWALWYASFGPGLVVLALGLVLFGLSTIKMKLISVRSVSALIIIALSTSLVSLGIKALFLFENEFPRLQNSSGLFMGILVLFGIVWIFLGLSLHRGAGMPIAIDE